MNISHCWHVEYCFPIHVCWYSCLWVLISKGKDRMNVSGKGPGWSMVSFMLHLMRQQWHKKQNVWPSSLLHSSTRERPVGNTYKQLYTIFGFLWTLTTFLAKSLIRILLPHTHLCSKQVAEASSWLSELTVHRQEAEGTSCMVLCED